MIACLRLAAGVGEQKALQNGRLIQAQPTRWPEKAVHGSACSWMIVLLGFTCPVDTRVMSSEAKTLRVPLAPSALKQHRTCAAHRSRGNIS